MQVQNEYTPIECRTRLVCAAALLYAGSCHMDKYTHGRIHSVWSGVVLSSLCGSWSLFSELTLAATFFRNEEKVSYVT